jgi:hypothetical protein
VHFEDTRVERRVVGQALASNGGGPQIRGNRGFGGVHNITIVNHTSEGTGDDSLGLFGILSGSVSGCHIADGYARGILLASVSDKFAENVRSGGNVVTRCPIMRFGNCSGTNKLQNCPNCHC